MRNKRVLKKYLIRTFSMVLCIIISGMIVAVPSSKAHAVSSPYLSDEIVENFMELFCDLGGEYTDEVKKFLEGGQDPTEEALENIFDICAHVFGVVDKVSFVEGAVKKGISDISFTFDMVEGLVSVVENAAEYCMASNPAKKVVDGLQLIEGAMKTVGLGAFFPANFSLVLNVCDVTFNIAGYLETQCFKEAVVLYEGDLLIAYYTDDEFPEPPRRTIDGFGLSASEVNSIYMHLYLHYNLKRLLDKANRTVIGGSNGASAGSTGNTGNSITGGIAFEKMYYSMPMNVKWQFTSSYYSSSAQTDISITYTSSNPSVFVTTKSGLVTPMGEGTAQLIATASNGVEATCNITVYPYSVTENGVGYTISNYVGSGGNVVIPDEIDGVAVTEIGEETFYENSTITSVTIPEGVTTIGNRAFEYCKALVDIVIPDSVTSIGMLSFYCCENLTKLTIPKNLTSIGELAFRSCKSLTSVTIPDSVTSIGERAFACCENLDGVYITNLESWCAIDFGDSFSNPLYHAKNLYINGKLATDIIIPSNVTNIGDYTFIGCTSLTSISIHDSVASIGKDAFYNCTSLATVYITDLAKWCDIDFCDSSSNPLAYADKFLVNGKLTTDIVVPNGVTSIGNHAFNNYESCTSITIPDCVTSIGDYAFSSCNGLISVSIPDSVIHIGKYAFERCENLISVSVGQKVTSIGNFAFYRCSSLEVVSMPDTLTSIGDGAFYCCEKLVSIKIPESLTFLGDYAFQKCKSITEINIPSSLSVINNATFSFCEGLTAITIPDNIVSIGDYAFSWCTNLKSVVLSEGIVGISEGAFYQCKALEEINLPSTIVELGDISSSTSGVFQYCLNLSEVLIPNGATYIGNKTFAGCTNLKSISIPKSVTSIGVSAFDGCSSLESVYITDIDAWCEIEFGDSVSNPMYYANNLFLNGELIRDIVISEGITSIPIYAFEGCKNLDSITIPDSIITIGGYAFNDCDELKYVFYKGSESDWANITIGNENVPLTNAAIHYNAVGHSYSTEWTVDVASTCITEGSKSHHCTVCGEKTDLTVVEPTEAGHNYLVTNTLSSHPHTITHTCSYCGDEKTEDSVSSTCIECNFTVTEIDSTEYKLVSYIGTETEVVIPATYNERAITSIAVGCFKGNTEITSVEIGDGVKNIGSLAFMNCSSLERVTIPASVTSIGTQAFYGFTGTIYCVKDSYAYDFAVANGIKYEIMGAEVSGEPIQDTKETTVDYENSLIYTTVENCSDITEILGLSDSAIAIAEASYIYGNTEFYGTGTVITVFDGAEYVGEFTLVVSGDVNGDGVCDVLDCSAVQVVSNGRGTLAGVYSMAADSNSDGVVDISDYQSIVNKAVS